MQARRQNKRPSFWRGIRTAALVLTVICSLGFLAQTAAANTFVITDGSAVRTHITFTTDPAVALDEAGVDLDATDTYTTALGDGVFEITVQRSQAVTVNHCGELVRADSYGETVGQLLNRLGIVVDADTRLSEDSGTAVYDGMVLTVERPTRVTETYTTVIGHDITYYEDPSLPAGVEAVVTEGRNGQVECTASVVYENGVEVSRTVLSQTVLEQPVDTVIALGTGAEQDLQAQCGLIIGDGIIITEDGQVLTYSSTMVVEATAYTHTDAGCDMITSTGTTVRVGTVAVDPRIIPYGTRMFIVSNDGKYVYGISTAEDCGGDIKNKRVDLYYPTKGECYQFGRRDVTIYFLG